MSGYNDKSDQEASPLYVAPGRQYGAIFGSF